MQASTRTSSAGRCLAGVLIWLVCCASVWAADLRYDTLLDTDDNAATGCTVATPKGPFQGAEFIVSTQVNTSTTGASVSGVTRRACTGGSFGASDTIAAGGWPVGLGQGLGGAAIVETYAPLALVGGGGPVRIGVVSYSGQGSDAILELARGLVPGAAGGTGGALPIPTLAPPVLLLLAAVIAWLASRTLRRHGAASVLVLGLALASAAGMAWAASIVLDGLAGDWAGEQPRATAAKGDAPANADLTALWFTQDAARAYIRIDADVALAGQEGNRPPTLALQDQRIAAGEPWALRLAARDADPSDTPAFALTSAPAGLALAPPPATPLLSWTPSRNDIGTHRVGVSVDDGAGGSAAGSFNVTVVGENRAPVLAEQADAQVPAGGAFQREIVATDPDGEAVTLALVSGPPGAVLSGSLLRWTAGSALGAEPFTLSASDPQGASTLARFVVRVLPHAPPVARDDPYIVRLGQTLAVPPAQGVLANDVEPSGGALAAAKTSEPDKGLLAAFGADGGFTYTAPPALPPAPPFKMALAWHSQFNSVTSISVGDVDGDGTPDVVYHAQNHFIRAERGSDGTELWQISRLPGEDYSDCSPMWGDDIEPLIADVDDDGNAEIAFHVFCGRDNSVKYPSHQRVAALDGRTGAVRWLSAQVTAGTPLPKGDTFETTGGAMLTVARLSPTDPPMIFGALTLEDYSAAAKCQYLGGTSDDKRCRRVFALDGRDGSLVKNWYATAPDQTYKSIDNYRWPGYTAGSHYEPPMIADLDGDGSIEILYEGTLWAADGTLLRQFDGTPERGNSSRYAVADLDGDGKADMVVVDGPANQLRALRLDGSLLWETPLARIAASRAVTITDVDGDGAPDVLIAGDDRLVVLDALGRTRWIKRYADVEGNYYAKVLGSDNRPAVYDLDGDGVPEVLLRVGGSLRALRGDTGAELDAFTFTTDRFQAAYMKGYPDVRVVDMDNDGAAEVVMGAANSGLGNPVGGIWVLRSANDPWMPVRKRQGAWIDLPGVVDDDGHVNLAGPAPGVGGRPNVYGHQVQQATREDLRTRTQASFQYEAHAGGLASPAATVRLNILPLNAPPRITSVAPTAGSRRHSGAADVNFSYQLSAVDPDPGDTLTWSVVDYTPTHGDVSYQPAVDAATGLLRLDNARGEPYMIVVRVTDSLGAYAEQAIRISFTPEVATVPDLAGLSQAAALTALADRTLVVGQVQALFNAAPAGAIVGQSPSATTEVPEGSSVHLLLSKGPEPRNVPSVVGRLAAEADSVLARAGFSTGSTRHVYSDTVERGRILAQTPAPGEQVVPGSVALEVSGGTGLAVALSRQAVHAGDTLTAEILSTAPDGTPQAAPAVTWSLTPRGEGEGPLPQLNGDGSITTAADTHGVYEVVATETAGGARVARASFAVLEADSEADPSPQRYVVQFVATLARLGEMSGALERARAAGDNAAMHELLSQMVAVWNREVNLDELRAVYPPTTDDVLLGPALQAALETLRELDDILSDDPGAITAYRSAVATLGPQVAALERISPSPYGVVAERNAYFAIMAQRLPGTLDRWFEAVEAALPALPKSQTRARPRARGASLAKFSLPISIAEVSAATSIHTLLAQKIYTPAVKHLSYSAATLSVARLLRSYFNTGTLNGIVTGSSLSFHVFDAPYSTIEVMNVDPRHPEATSVLVIGPTAIDAILGLKDKIVDLGKSVSNGTSSAKKAKNYKEIWKQVESIRDSLGNAIDEGFEAYKAFDPTNFQADLGYRGCLLSPDNRCSSLVYKRGISAVNTCSEGELCLPAAVIVIVWNQTDGGVGIEPYVFLPKFVAKEE